MFSISAGFKVHIAIICNERTALAVPVYVHVYIVASPNYYITILKLLEII